MSNIWFITGASRGIGLEIAKAALSAGHKVVASGRNLQQLQMRFDNYSGEQVLCLRVDVSNAVQVEAAVAAAVAYFGNIDVLVNNAGYGLFGNFEEVEPEIIEQQFATNVFGLMHVTRAVLPVMRSQRSGRIFNVSSIAGIIGFTGASLYCATKFAVEGFSASLTTEVAQFGIHVILVEPGFFRTDFLEKTSIQYGTKLIDDYTAHGSVEANYDQYNQRQAGDPAKLGSAVVTLAAMPLPPTHFLAGSDAIAYVRPTLEARLVEIDTMEELTRSTDGDF